MTDQPVRLATAAMGTRFELLLVAGAGDLRVAGEAAIEEIETWHRRLSRFAPDSLVSHINREAFRAPVVLDRDTFELLHDALDVCRASGGAFDISVASREARSGAGAVRLNDRDWSIQLAGPHVSIDLGGIGKGHALDCAARVLRAAGVTCGLLHGGTSSVLAMGAPDGIDGWRVAIPSEAGSRTVALRDEALSISDPSGSAEARREVPHIMNPRHGEAVSARIRASVVGPSARLADAWSTALVVLGRAPDTFPSRFSAFIDVREPAVL